MKRLKRRVNKWLEKRRLHQIKYLPTGQRPKDAIIISKDEWYPEDDIYERILTRRNLAGSHRV